MYLARSAFFSYLSGIPTALVTVWLMLWKAHIDRRYEFSSAMLLALYLSDRSFERKRVCRCETERVSQTQSHLDIWLRSFLWRVFMFIPCLSVLFSECVRLSDNVSSVMDSNNLWVFLSILVKACLDTLLQLMTLSSSEDSKLLYFCGTISWKDFSLHLD